MLPSHHQARTLARGRGWFSLALGAAALIGVRPLCTSTDRPRIALMAGAYGLISVVNGAGLVYSAQPRPWIWARVGGDLIDLAIVALAVRNRSTRSVGLTALVALVATTAMDVACARSLSKPKARAADYRHRSGGSRAGDPMRRIALRNFEPATAPCAPSAMPPWPTRTKPPVRAAR